MATNFNFNEYLDGVNTEVDSILSRNTTPSKTDTLSQNKQKKIQDLSTKSAQSKPVLTELTGNDFYDADSPFNVNKNIGDKGTFRLGNPNDSKYNYYNAPENPSTIKGLLGRNPTEEEKARFDASMMVKDNFAMGTTPASKESIQDMIANPLTPENKAIYDEYMKKSIAESGDTLEFRGDTNNIGIKGRQVGQVFNPEAPNKNESLQDRLLTTGVGGMYSLGKPIKESLQGVEDLRLVEGSDKDSRVKEAIDQAQSQGLKQWGDMAKAGRSASRWLVGKLGINPDDIGLTENPRLLGTDQLVEDIRSNEKLRDSLTGFETREAWQLEQAKFQGSVKDGKYMKAAWNVVTNLDRYLADSAPEMALIMTPVAGLPSVIGTRLNNQMEDFEKNNGRPMTPGEALKTAALITATLVPEKLLVKTGAKKVLGGLSKGSKGKKDVAVGVAGTAAGESLQEAAETVQETYSTQKIGDKSLEEIVKSDETIGAAIAGGVVGGSLRGGGEAVAATVRNVPVQGAVDSLSKVSGIVADKVGGLKEDAIDETAPIAKAKPEDVTKANDLAVKLKEAVTNNDNKALGALVTEMTELATTSNTDEIASIVDSAAKEVVAIRKAKAEEALVKGKTEVLGAEASDIPGGDKVELVRMMMDTLDIKSLESSKNNVKALADKLGIDAKELEKDRQDTIKAKSIDEVSQDVESGDRGYSTYVNSYKIASAKGDKIAQADAQDKLELFRTKHENKLEVFNENIDEVERDVYTLAEQMVSEGRAPTRAKALSDIANGEINFETGENTYGTPIKVGTFTVYPENVAQKLIGVNPSAKSVYATRDRISKEVTTMRELEDGLVSRRAPEKVEEKATEVTPRTVAEKISKGEEILAEDLQVQDNDGKAVEEELVNIQKESQKAKPEPTQAKKPTNDKVVEEKPKAPDGKALVKEIARLVADNKLDEAQELVNKSNFNKKTKDTMTNKIDGKRVKPVGEVSIETKPPERVQTKEAPKQVDKTEVTTAQKKSAEDKLKGLEELVSEVVNQELKVKADAKFKEERRSFIEDLGTVEGNKVVLPETITKAMTKALVAWMAVEAKGTTFGSSKKVEQMLGLRKNPSRSAVAALKDRGLLRKNVVQELGEIVISNLDMDIDKKEDYARRQNYTTNFGNIVFATMLKRGLVEQTSIPTKQFNSFKRVEGGEGDVFFGKYIKDDKTLNYYKSIADTLDLAPERNSKLPNYGKPESREEFEFRKRPDAVMDDKDVERLRAQENVEHSFKYGVAQALEGLGEFAKVAAGWKDVRTLDNIHEEAKGSVEALNEAIERSLEHVATHKENLNKTGHKGYYFKYFMSGNGRDMMDSNTFNPQSDKIHRHLDHTGEPVRVEEGGANFEMFKKAVLQGLGEGVDKESDATVNTKWNQSTDRESEVAEMAYMATDSVSKLSNTDKKRLAEFLAGREKIHTLDALVALGDFLRAQDKGDNFTMTNLQIEVDAVTSGWILALMQSPVFDYDTVKSFLRKGGVYIDDVDTNFQELAESKAEPDSYVTVKNAIARRLEETLAPETMEILPVDRNLAKSPFMTRITYGAGIKGVKDDLADQFIDKVYDRMAKATTKEELVRLRRGVKELSGKDLGGLTLENKTTFEIPFSTRTKIESAVKDTYGKAVDEALDGTYAEFTETRDAINEAFKEMAEVYTSKYESGYKKLQAKYGKVTKEMKERFESEVMSKYIPGIRSPNGSSVQIFKKEKMEAVNPSDLRVQNNFLSPIGVGTNAITTTAEIKRIGAAHAAGGVVPIHFIDGVVIGDVLKDYQVTGVYDAVMVNLNDVENVTKAYNKKFTEVSKDYNLLEEVLRSHKILVGKSTEASSFLKAKSKIANENRERIHSSNLNIQHFAMGGIRHEQTRKSQGKAQLSSDIMSLVEEQVNKGCVK